MEQQKTDLVSGLERIRNRVQERFRGSSRVLSFQEYLREFSAQPSHHLRTAPQYVLEMFDHFGTRQSVRVGQDAKRFRVFDLDTVGRSDMLAGQERVQEALWHHLASFAKRGRADKMLLLHGPNGSGKTTAVDGIFRGLEVFSRTSQGALYTFSWIFADADGNLDRIGFEPATGGEEEAEKSEIESYAHLDDDDVASRLDCELRDSPLFLIPRDDRAAIIEAALREYPSEKYPELRYDPFIEGDLCQKCRKIYERLLVAYQGDWKKIVRHVQVSRFYISRRYRVGAVSIEPQGNIDAGVRPILGEHAYSIPPLLKNVSLFEPLGDIVDANRGVLEYSDLLKRPMEANKYLLTTCERGTVNLPNCMAYLDLVILGTANEKQLSVFKRSPDFSSFKGRIELIPVPYLLRYSAESDLYERHIRSYSRGRDIAPHTARVAALWAVLTRLRRPKAEHYDEPLRSVVTQLTPIEKATLYDRGEPPDRFTEEQRKLLRSSVLRIRTEFEETEGEFEGIYGAEYEGRRGVSPREMLSVIARAAEVRRYRCLTPMAVLESIEELLKDSSLYDFLRLPADGEYRDMRGLLDAVRAEYFQWVTAEVYNSISLVDEGEYDRVFRDYFRHVKAFDSGEGILNQRTGEYESPDEERMRSIEEKAGIREPGPKWRSNVMLRIAAWSLDHTGQSIDYHRLFPDIYKSLRDHFYQERDRLLTLIEQDLLKYGTDEFQFLSSQEQEQVLGALDRMEKRYGYSRDCAREVIAHVVSYRHTARARNA